MFLDKIIKSLSIIVFVSYSSITTYGYGYGYGYGSSEFTKEINIPNYPDVRIHPTDGLSYYMTGALKCGKVLQGSKISYKGQEIALSEFTNICFHRNGLVAQIRAENRFQFTRLDLLFNAGGTVKFNEIGEVISALVELEDTNREIKVGNYTLQLRKFNQVAFDETNPEKLVFIARATNAHGAGFIFNQGYLHGADNIQFYPNGIIKSLFSYSSYTGRSHFFNNGISVAFAKYPNVKPAIEFYPNGNIKKILIKGESTFKTPLTPIKIAFNERDPDYTFFYSDGKIHKAILAENVQLKFHNKNHVLQKGTWFEISEQGHLLSATFGEAASFKIANGKTINCWKGRVDFHSNGSLRSCLFAHNEGFFESNILTRIKPTKDFRVFFNSKGWMIGASFYRHQNIRLKGYGNKIREKFIATDNENLLETDILGEITLNLQNKSILFGSKDKFERFKFHEHQRMMPKEARLAEDTKLEVIGGTKTFYRGDWICVNKKGFAGLKSGDICHW